MHRGLLVTASLAVILTSSCSPEAKICGRMDTLCGTPKPECQELVRSTKESMGDKGIDALQRCFAEATTCGEANGCVTGMGFKHLGAAVGDFLKGLGKGLDDGKDGKGEKDGKR